METVRWHCNTNPPLPSPLNLLLTGNGLFGCSKVLILITFESQVDTRRQLKTLDKPSGLIQTLRMQNITYARHYKIGNLPNLYFYNEAAYFRYMTGLQDYLNFFFGYIIHHVTYRHLISDACKNFKWATGPISGK